MSNLVFYTKGDKDEVLMRLSQVHTITMHCPINDYAVTNLRNALTTILPKYQTEENLWKNVPAIDALNAVIITKTLCDCSGFDVDGSIIGIICASLKMFKKLKKISFDFTDDPEIESTYQNLIKKNKEGIKKSIYTVDVIEMNLSDMFSQDIIDFFNRVLMYNEIIPNLYFKRVFSLDFTYDNYVSFITMFLSNNREEFEKLDNKIYDYFSAFPELVKEQKPTIRVITNYSEI